MIAASAQRGCRMACSALALVTALLTGQAAMAHAEGASYLRIAAPAAGAVLQAGWDIAAADLELPLELDADGNGHFDAEEIAARHAAIARFATGRLAIRRGDADCRLEVGTIGSMRRDQQPFLALHLTAHCAEDGALGVRTRLFFGSPGYVALLDVQTSAGRFAAILSPASPAWSEPVAETWLGTARDHLRQGIHHVLVGYDHIAFLVLLLLPSILRSNGASRAVVPNARGAARDLVRIVTAFTVAHSITLGLAVTGAVRPPAQPIELAIAGSIVVTGVVNLFPRAARWRLGLAFAFGLVHGFGFANAFREIGGAGSRLAPMLGGFNLGVEVGQLLIVGAVLPILWLLGRSPAYARRIMPALSLATAMTGAVWFAIRL